jgi:iron complex transport system ATP-binding protein
VAERDGKIERDTVDRSSTTERDTAVARDSTTDHEATSRASSAKNAVGDEAALVARGLEVKREGRVVLSNVDVRVRRGELLAVLGPNGAGKSTLLRALAGLLPSTGELVLDGRALRTLSDVERARSIAFVPQRSGLVSPFSAAEVVAQGRYARGGASPRSDEVRAALARVGASAFAERAFTTLSVGEQQRVLLARALATDATVLVLDEPTAPLDVGQALATFTLLRSLAAEGRALVAAVHGLDDARRFADRVLVLENGRMRAEGAPREVVADSLLRPLYGVSLREDAAPRFDRVGDDASERAGDVAAGDSDDRSARDEAEGSA